MGLSKGMLPVENPASNKNPHDGDNYYGKSKVNPATPVNGEQLNRIKTGQMIIMITLKSCDLYK